MISRVLIALAFLAAGPQAFAEIALLFNGLTLKLEGHRVEDGLLVLVLEDGGEIGVPPETVRGFVPDEIVEEVVGPIGTDLRSLAIATARKHGLDPELVLAVVGVESAFRPEGGFVEGRAGAHASSCPAPPPRWA